MFVCEEARKEVCVLKLKSEVAASLNLLNGRRRASN